VKNTVFDNLGAGETMQTTTWKSYMRKSASIAAKMHSRSEILSENREI